MSIDNPKWRSRAPDHAASDASDGAERHEDENRKQDNSCAADFAADVVINGAQIVIDGVGNVVSSVVSSLGDIG